jgi:uncharacterized protein
MASAAITPDLILDARLALFHRAARWMVVADLHYGYEVAQRTRGWLLPAWGMNAVEERLTSLVLDYQPKELILLGDIVHSSITERLAQAFLGRVEKLGPELHLIRGNHDRGLSRLRLADSVQRNPFFLHHGHLNPTALAETEAEITGHYHPSWCFSDGAGTRLRAPALVRSGNRVILPAFSPWAAGAQMDGIESAEVWICAPNRVFRVIGGKK